VIQEISLTKLKHCKSVLFA